MEKAPAILPATTEARGPPLWELPVPGQTEWETDLQAQPAPDYAAQQIPFRDEFDQRVAW